MAAGHQKKIRKDQKRSEFFNRLAAIGKHLQQDLKRRALPI
jgi:hypothetical protein